MSNCKKLSGKLCFYSEVLSELNDCCIKNFDCGNAEINNHIKRYTSYSKSERFFVMIEADTNRAICVYSLKATAITREHNAKQGAYYDPAIEIAIFAVDKEFQDTIFRCRGSEACISDYMLCAVIDKIAEICRSGCAVQYIMLFSTLEAVNFYKRNKFKEFNQFMKNNDTYIRYCQPMYLPLSDDLLKS